MRQWVKMGILLSLLVPVAAAGGAAAQDLAPLTAGQTDAGVLSSEEERAFDRRLQAAATEQERTLIRDERARLIAVRLHKPAEAIPPSSRELSQDPLMPDVPTPPLARSGPSGNELPGGALSGTGTGTGPATSPGALTPAGQ